MKRKSGWLTLQRLVIDSFEREEFILFSGIDEQGNSLDHEPFEKLFHCQVITQDSTQLLEQTKVCLDSEAQRHIEATISRSLEENDRHFNEVRERLEKWAEDMILAVEKELKDTKQQINTLNRQARLATTMEEQRET